ncbi:hypothetical protein BKA61DRAFT_616431, partial [Leptodontidium sp. MPI-SDFR-AT-0119]
MIDREGLNPNSFRAQWRPSFHCHPAGGGLVASRYKGAEAEHIACILTPALSSNISSLSLPGPCSRSSMSWHILAMPSQSKGSWEEAFNLRLDEPSSAGAETGPSGDTTSGKGDADDCDNDSLVSTRPPSYRSQITDVESSGDEEFSKDQVDCSACGTQHPLFSFHDIGIKNIDHRRRCLGSERVLYLCAHAFMTWDQFRREIVDIFPYHIGFPSSPQVLTITYARDSGLSVRDAVMRHKHGSHCQAWEGAWHSTAKPAPSGLITFQKKLNQILWYSAWHIAVPEVWCKEEECVVEGRGPAREKSFETAVLGSKTQDLKAQASEGKRCYPVFKKPVTVEEEVPFLAERLTSLEIYLCPHVNFFSPVVRPSLIHLLETKFRGSLSVSMYPKCPECGASFTIYARQKLDSQKVDDVDSVVIIVARIIGTGASAMEREWLNATEIRV